MAGCVFIAGVPVMSILPVAVVKPPVLISTPLDQDVSVFWTVPTIVMLPVPVD